MQFPAFFDQIPRLQVRDPLADILGAAESGQFEYGYADAVKLAGHSCPTVATAYLLGHRALATLYPDQIPERGGVRIEFSERLDAGVTGVTAAVLTLLTGASHDGGLARVWAGVSCAGICSASAANYRCNFASSDSTPAPQSMREPI